MNFIGIDPGKHGAIVVLDSTSSKCKSVLKFSTATLKDRADFLFDWSLEPCYAYLEKVDYMKGDGGKGAFTFGYERAIVEMALVCRSIPYELVRAQDWQRKLNKGPIKAHTYAERKRKLKQLAEQYFPHEKITLDVADAYLIALYGLRTHQRT